MKSDVTAELRTWCKSKSVNDLVFNVPARLHRILNRDLVAAGIDKIDDRKRHVHLHAVRHSTGTHLSAAGVSRRTAQAVVRHSDIALQMSTYTDERLLETSAAMEHLPDLPVITTDTEAHSSVAPTVAPASYKTCQNGSWFGKLDKDERHVEKPSNQEKTPRIAGLNRDGRYRTRIIII